MTWEGSDFTVTVGDSRKGWVDAYQVLIDMAFSRGTDLNVTVDLSQIRGAGEKLKGFGGTANPVKLPVLFEKVIALLNSRSRTKSHANRVLPPY